MSQQINIAQVTALVSFNIPDFRQEGARYATARDYSASQVARGIIGQINEIEDPLDLERR